MIHRGDAKTQRGKTGDKPKGDKRRKILLISLVPLSGLLCVSAPQW
jgi:hypothetical protein